MRVISFLAVVMSLVTVTLAITPAENIERVFQRMLTVAADKVLPPAKDIDALSAGLAILGEGPYPVVARGLGELTADCDTIAEIIEDTLTEPPILLNIDESEAIVTSYYNAASFVLPVVNTLIEKASIVDSLVTVGGQIRPQLAHLRQAIVDMSQDLIGVFESPSVDPLNNAKETLVSAIDIAISKYTPVIEV